MHTNAAVGVTFGAASRLMFYFWKAECIYRSAVHSIHIGFHTMFFRRLFLVTNFMWFIHGWWRCHRSVGTMQAM